MGGNGWGQYHIRIDAGPEQHIPSLHRLELVSDDYWQNGRLTHAGVISHGSEFPPHRVCDLVNPLDSLRLSLDNVQSRQDGCDACRRQTCAEDERPCEMLYPVDDLLIACD